MGGLVVASFNLHAGVDGWGAPFDLRAVLAALDADAVVLEESFSPAGGPSLAELAGAELGYEVVAVPLARARRLRLAGPGPGTRGRWGPPKAARARSLWLELPRHTRRQPPRQRRGEPGTWDLAVLSRVPIETWRAVPLPALRRDGPERHLVEAVLATDAGPFTLAATHLAHLSAGSPIQIRALARLLAHQSGPAALLGDMNCFGPPLVALLPGWRRAVRGRSWPSWRPCCQPDHVLVNKAVRVVAGRVVPLGGSDHLPVRAELAF